MRRAVRKILAFLVRDYRQEVSYKLDFLSQWGTIFLNILVWYFLARFAGGAFEEGLKEYGGDFFSFVLIGVALWGYQNTAIGSLRRRIREAQTLGTMEALLATRTSPNLIIVGSLTYDFAFQSLQVVGYFVFGYVLFEFQVAGANVFGTLVVLLLAIAAFLGIGIMAGAFTMTFKKGDPVTWIFTTLSVPLGGVIYPVSALPVPLQWISAVLPVTYALDAMRRTWLNGASLSEVGPSLLNLALFAGIVFPLSLLLFRHSLRMAKERGSLVQY